MGACYLEENIIYLYFSVLYHCLVVESGAIQQDRKNRRAMSQFVQLNWFRNYRCFYHFPRDILLKIFNDFLFIDFLQSANS